MAKKALSQAWKLFEGLPDDQKLEFVSRISSQILGADPRCLDMFKLVDELLDKGVKDFHEWCELRKTVIRARKRNRGKEDRSAVIIRLRTVEKMTQGEAIRNKELTAANGGTPMTKDELQKQEARLRKKGLLPAPELKRVPPK
jgi:hypothetical protein